MGSFCTRNEDLEEGIELLVLVVNVFARGVCGGAKMGLEDGLPGGLVGAEIGADDEGGFESSEKLLSWTWNRHVKQIEGRNGFGRFTGVNFAACFRARLMLANEPKKEPGRDTCLSNGFIVSTGRAPTMKVVSYVVV